MTTCIISKSNSNLTLHPHTANPSPRHAAALTDLLVGGGVSPDKMKMVAFTDSDHSINYNGADVYLYKFLTARLWDEVQRKVAAPLVHQWSKKSLL